MPWERRGRKRYYYRKVRLGDRVVSEYVGAGADASLAASVDTLQRNRRRAAAGQWAAHHALDARLAALCDLADALVWGALLAAGFRTHKGQWRKKRHA